ncbi:MAG: hypothetical protein IKE01_01895 [Clostridia bacterium]|nr:hypothetical protein [Clostridia bacterium]
MKVFIAGPRVIREINEKITEKLDKICEKKYDVLIGDADGVDSCVQKYFQQKSYKNVKVYASNGLARNNYGDWQIENVVVDKFKKGFYFYAEKDLKMVKDAEIGFMIWNGKSRGTFNNIVNLLNYGKRVILYYTQNDRFYYIKNMDELETFLGSNITLNSKLKALLPQKKLKSYTQICLF